jgi:hypothetical protein
MNHESAGRFCRVTTGQSILLPFKLYSHKPTFAARLHETRPRMALQERRASALGVTAGLWSLPKHLICTSELHARQRVAHETLVHTANMHTLFPEDFVVKRSRPLEARDTWRHGRRHGHNVVAQQHGDLFSRQPNTCWTLSVQ